MTPRMKAIRRLQNIADKRWKRHWDNALAPWVGEENFNIAIDKDEEKRRAEEHAEAQMGRHAYSWACRMAKVEKKSIAYALKVLKEDSE